ncbi:MAG: alpha/beta hydrolase [Candidatus Eremiobacteraeota bacterium]|nr:alpha/beta hydrolase [Candidatus Eremiobacteraeota bacterium]
MSALQLLNIILAAVLPLGPAGNAFYTPPSPLPAATHGDVIWQRPLMGGAAIASAARNVLVLYHTINPDGKDVAISGTLAIPHGTPPPGGWPLVSWAHGTTGNGPQCTPSRDLVPNGEQRMLDAWVARGYAVAQTDYEGQGTPGVHPYFIARAAAHDVTDMVRAARQIDSDIATRWIVLGHSEGGTAAIATAAMGQAWAPELKLIGAVSYAPGSQITYILDGMLHSATPPLYLPLFGLMVKSFATYDPAIQLEKVFTTQFISKLDELQSRCERTLSLDRWWTTQVSSDIFLERPDLGPISKDFIANEPGTLHPTVPVLLVQGMSDRVVGADATRALDQDLCHNGVQVRLDLYAGKNHGTVLAASLENALAWAQSAFRGVSPASNCGSSPNML